MAEFCKAFEEPFCCTSTRAYARWKEFYDHADRANREMEIACAKAKDKNFESAAASFDKAKDALLKIVHKRYPTVRIACDCNAHDIFIVGLERWLKRSHKGQSLAKAEAALEKWGKLVSGESVPPKEASKLAEETAEAFALFQLFCETNKNEINTKMKEHGCLMEFAEGLDEAAKADLKRLGIVEEQSKHQGYGS